MSNYLETLVEKMVADGVSEQDIKSVIEEVNAKKSPLKQGITGTTTQEGEDDIDIQTATTTQPTTTIQPTTAENIPIVGETEEGETECPEGYYWDEDRGTCYREDAKVTDEDEKEEEEWDSGTWDYDYSYLEEPFEESVSKIEGLVEENLTPGKKTRRQRYDHRKASEDIYKGLDLQSDSEKKAYEEYLFTKNIYYDPENGFQSIDKETEIPEVSIKDTPGSELESITGIYEEIGGKFGGPEVREELEEIQKEVEAITQEDPDIQQELLEDCLLYTSPSPRD